MLLRLALLRTDRVPSRTASARTALARGPLWDDVVELVDLGLSAAIAGVAPARGDPCHAHGGMAGSESHTGVVGVVDPAASDDEGERTGDIRHEPVGPGDGRPGSGLPMDLDVPVRPVRSR